jgi:phage shock protein A
MPLMLAKTYAAFKAAGVSDDDAQAAAEELADYESRLGAIDTRLARVETGLDAMRQTLGDFKTKVTHRFSLLTWTVGINAAATIAILGILLRH